MTLATPTSRLRASVGRVVPTRVRTLSRSAIAFGLVGLGGMVIDLGVFNLLRLGLLGPSFSLMYKPLTASVVSASIAIIFNWAGGRYWAFRDTRRSDAVKEFAEYVAVALLGLGIGIATLAFTHYTLGFTSLAADNVSKNVIGLGLGTITRFVLLRFWVYARRRVQPGEPVTQMVATSTAAIELVHGAKEAVSTSTAAIAILAHSRGHAHGDRAVDADAA